MRAGNYLGVMCLFFGAALAAFVSGSLEPRLGNLFVFGVMPAVGFSAGGYVLGRLHQGRRHENRYGTRYGTLLNSIGTPA